MTDKMNNEINIGNTIKKIRMGKGIILKSLAKKCGITSSMLSQIEKGVANPSLNTIKSIAFALETPLFKFFMDEDKKVDEIKILKKKNRKKIIAQDITYEMISPESPTNIECMVITFDKKDAETSVRPAAHKGEEIAVLLSGKVEITIGKTSKVMNVGDSVFIPALAPHKWKNINNGKSIILFSVTPYEF